MKIRNSLSTRRTRRVSGGSTKPLLRAGRYLDGNLIWKLRRSPRDEEWLDQQCDCLNRRQLIIPFPHPCRVRVTLGKSRVPIPLKKTLTVRHRPKLSIEVSHYTGVGKKIDVVLAVPLLPDAMYY